MDITKYISKGCVVPQLLAANKSEAIKELTHLLFDKKRLKGIDVALDQVVAREAMESTGVGHGIAIPHARVAGVKGLVCAVGRISGGIDFDAIDRKPVHLVLLIVYPPTQQTVYLGFLAMAMRLLRDPENRAAMLKADTADTMFEILESGSKNLIEHPERVAQKVETDPRIAQTQDAHPDLVLLARLQFYEEMMGEARTGKTQLRQRIEKIRSLVDPRLLKHYDRLMRAQPPALVAVEADTCQGCYMKLPSKFAQQVRQDTSHIHTCANCSRFIYVV